MKRTRNSLLIPEGIRINGKKVILREKKLSDARNDYEWARDPLLSRLDAALPLNIGFSRFLDEYNAEMHFSYSLRIRFAIETIDGEHIGNCSCYNIDIEHGEAEIGIMIGKPAYWNKGYGTDTIKTIVDYIFRNTNFNRLYLKTLDWNARAQKCFIKSGFIPYNRVHRDGHIFILMELKRDTWERFTCEQENNGTDTGSTG